MSQEHDEIVMEEFLQAIRSIKFSQGKKNTNITVVTIDVIHDKKLSKMIRSHHQDVEDVNTSHYFGNHIVDMGVQQYSDQ